MTERWRVGTSEGTDGLTLYRHVDDGPERGRLVGMMREPEDAALVVEAVNHRLSNTEIGWEYGVRYEGSGGEPDVHWRGGRQRAADWLEQGDRSGVLVCRLVTFGPVEEVPGDA